MKILLADDSVTAQNMGKKILTEAGHEVVCVSNGAAALKKVSEQEPDLVILDIYMPGYSGLEVCQRLKEGGATADLPVVLSVGKLEPFRKEDAQRVRAEALIVKPFEASELAAAVARFGETVAAKPAKPKSRGKLGPQPKPNPQWEESPEDEFVTTTQLLEEKAEPGQEEKSAETPLPAADEFPATPEAAAAEAQPAPLEATGVEASETSHLESDVENPSVEGNTPEFSVQPASTEDEYAVVPAQDMPAAPPLAARAVAAGAESTGVETGAGAEFPVRAPVENFAVSSPAEPAAEPTASPAEIKLEAQEMAAAPNPAWGAISEAAAEAQAVTVPPVDPAFDPDRTHWATEFPTQFGISAAQPPEQPGPAESAAGEEEESPTTAHDEVAAILSGLPGGLSSPEPETNAASPGQEVETTSLPAAAWKAEEIPVEDGDSSISLAEEMAKAWQEPAGEAIPEQDIAPAEAATEPAVASPASGAETSENTRQQTPDAGEVAEQADTESNVPASQLPPKAAVAAAAETQAPNPQPDPLTGVMQSAAMAIATRATVSAVASQLHAPESANANSPAGIEELVSQVLERLKPKLIAEVKRELGNEEK